MIFMSYKTVEFFGGGRAIEKGKFLEAPTDNLIFVAAK